MLVTGPTHKLTHTGKQPERTKEYRAGFSCPVPVYMIAVIFRIFVIWLAILLT